MYESSIDAVEEYVDTLIDGYNDYIDSVKEALDAERDLYDFKRKIEDQSKSVAETERKIAALSGSTNAADVAERRRLEKELFEQKRDLEDSYRDHSLDTQNEALDAEQEAYEETMTKMVEGMRTSLQEATADMDTFLNNVTIAVSMNADTVLAKYKETNVYLDPALTNPWEKAKTKVGEYGDKANNLMDVWKEGGYFAKFSSEAGTNLSAPWNNGTDAANAFKNSVDGVMDDVVEKIESNVQSAATKLSDLYKQIIDTENRAKTANIDIGDLDDKTEYSYGDDKTDEPPKKSMNHVSSTTKEIILGSQDYIDNNTKTIDGTPYFLFSENGTYYKISDLKKRKYDGGRTTGWAIPAYTAGYQYYAKGTTGTTRDEWAITDESWIGEEITLAAGKNGQLQYLKKGSAVMPADISANLVEWGKLDPSMLNLTNQASNINMISNAVVQPNYEFNFDSLVHVDHCDEGTLKSLEKMVDNKINDFGKQLNYSIKKFAR